MTMIYMIIFGSVLIVSKYIGKVNLIKMQEQDLENLVI